VNKKKDVLKKVVLLLLTLIIAPRSANPQLDGKTLSETQQGVCSLPPCACRPLIG